MKKSDLYFQALVNAMKSNIGRIFFKNDKIVLISCCQVTNTYPKSIIIQYLDGDKIFEYQVDNAQDFFRTFLTKNAYAKKQMEKTIQNNRKF